MTRASKSRFRFVLKRTDYRLENMLTCWKVSGGPSSSTQCKAEEKEGEQAEKAPAFLLMYVLSKEP